MYLLLLKTEKNAGINLNFVGMYDSKESAERQVGPEYRGFGPSGFGNYRMLSGFSGSRPAKDCLTTSVFQGSSFLLAEF